MKQSFATNNQLFGTGAHLWEKEGLSLSYIQGFQLFGIIRGRGGKVPWDETQNVPTASRRQKQYRKQQETQKECVKRGIY
jgi:hypothetical protein